MTQMTMKSSRQLLAHYIEAPDLPARLRSLEPRTFSALVREVGIADAGDLVALATAEQLQTAFDENLFSNAAPGEREAFQVTQFVLWLEVLMQHGADLAAAKASEWDEDSLALAISELVVVLDHETLLAHMAHGGPAAASIDKHLESSFVEELDGYLLVARQADGWDAIWSLIVALDGSHRDLLVRVLDVCVHATSELLDDLSELRTVLSSAESLMEDVEAAREQRRTRLGYVDARQARAFLTLARHGPPDTNERDPITRAYFRELEGRTPVTESPGARTAWTAAVEPLAENALLLGSGQREHPPASAGRLLGALRLLQLENDASFTSRVDELAYLVNVVISGAQNDGARFSAASATEAVLTTVEFGAVLEAPALSRGARSQASLCQALATVPADVLFRRASAKLVAHGLGGAHGVLKSDEELKHALSTLEAPTRRAASV